MEGRSELVKALAELVRAPESMLSRVCIQRDLLTMRYEIIGDNGETLLVLNAEDLNGASVLDALHKKFHSLVCADCGTLLLDSEAGLCGPCEAHTVMDLLRMSAALT